VDADAQPGTIGQDLADRVFVRVPVGPQTCAGQTALLIGAADALVERVEQAEVVSLEDYGATALRLLRTAPSAESAATGAADSPGGPGAGGRWP